MIEVRELNANGSIVSLAIIDHALEMAGLSPETPCSETDKWTWRVSPLQKMEMMFLGFAKTVLVDSTKPVPPEFEKYKGGIWTVAAIPVKTLHDLPRDVIELWREDQLVVVITSLWIRPQFSEASA